MDDRLAAAGTPVALDARRLGNVFRMSGGVLRVRSPLGEGQRYRVWSYAPDPAPAVLARSTPHFPAATRRYLELDGRDLPVWRSADRDSSVRELLGQPANDRFEAYTALYEIAGRVTRSAESPYAAVLALESWFRQRGGFVYDEQPPNAEGPPLVSFATRTKAGYCQHYAGAMAVMLRMLGIPARVAVGFTSGTLRRRSLGRDRPRGACLGRGVVRRSGLGSVRSRLPVAERSPAPTRSLPTRRTRWRHFAAET